MIELQHYHAIIFPTLHFSCSLLYIMDRIRRALLPLKKTNKENEEKEEKNDDFAIQTVFYSAKRGKVIEVEDLWR